jgi:hypothetical protein
LSHISCCKRERHHGPGIRPCEPPANRTRPAQIAELKATGCAKMFPEKASGARGDRAELARVIKRLQPGTCRFSHVATPLPNFPLLLTHGRNLKATSAGTSGSSNGFGRRAIMGLVRLIAPFVVICFATGALFAQTPALDSAVQRKVDLTVAQKQILYQSIGNIQKNDAAPTGFTATVGADIPSGIALVPVPETIAEIIPQTKGLETAMVEGQVLLVEPQGKTIVAVIALEL